MSRTQQRGFIWLSLILLILCAVAIFWPTRSEENTMPAPAICDSSTQPTKHVSPKQPSSRPYTKYIKEKQPIEKPKNPEDHQYRSKPFFVVDLNSADTNDLKELRGIGPVFSNRIVRYRNSMGGFYCKEQLLEVYGMTDSLYCTIAPHLTLDTSLIRKINLNSITLDSLKRHPYLDYWQAKAIIQYRNTIQRYSQPEELLLVTLIDQKTFDRIKPYITCN